MGPSDWRETWLALKTPYLFMALNAIADGLIKDANDRSAS